MSSHPDDPAHHYEPREHDHLVEPVLGALREEDSAPVRETRRGCGPWLLWLFWIGAGLLLARSGRALQGEPLARGGAEGRPEAACPGYPD